MPNEGVYVNRKVTREQAEMIMGRHLQIVSAVGHQATADALDQMFPNLGGVPVNRIQAQMQPGDEAICLKLMGRLEEGRILTMPEMEAIGYELYHVTNLGASFNSDGSVMCSTVGYLATNFNSQPWVHGTSYHSTIR